MFDLGVTDLPFARDDIRQVREVKVAVFLPAVSRPRGAHFMACPSISHWLRAKPLSCHTVT